LARRTNNEQSFEGFGTFYNRFVNYAVNLSSAQKRTQTILGVIIILVLSTLASIPFVKEEWFQWVQALVGFPAGVILFAILVGLVKTTKFGNSEIFLFKERNSHNQRIRAVAIFSVIVIIILIFVGKFLPYGVGGTLVVAMALTIYNLLRRTPEEISLGKQGIVDPRDIRKEEDDA